jgi:hypothetical protein
MNTQLQFASAAIQQKNESERDAASIKRCLSRAAALISMTAIMLHLVANPARSTGGFVQVPLRWVAVEGSPIAGKPVPTAELIARMNNANTVLSQAGISLVSGLRSRTTFPIINDPDLPNIEEALNGAVLGDIHASRFSQEEVRQVRRRARRALDLDLIPVNRRGIVGIAAGRFNRDDGMSTNTIGWGFRVRQMFIVEDPDRAQLRLTPLGPPDEIGMVDPDRLALGDAILVSHEVGHVLGLNHRGSASSTPVPVMRSFLGEVAPGEVRVFGPGESDQMRFRGAFLAGSLVDPPGLFEPGPVIGAEVLDRFAGDENANPIPEYLDLDGAATSFDQDSNTISFQQELWGLIPEANLAGDVNYWTLVDIDCNKATGASGSRLGQLGLNTAFDGADLAMRAKVSSNGQELTTVGQVWEFENDQIFDAPQAGTAFSVERDMAEPMYAHDAPPDPSLFAFPVSDVIFARLDNNALRIPFVLDQPFKFQMILQQEGTSAPADLLDDQEQGLESRFAIPDYPNAFVVDQDGNPIAGRFIHGQLIPAVAEGLLPNSPFEVYLGDRLMAAASTGPNGEASIAFQLDTDLPLGFHALSFVNTGTAVMASNVIEILGPPPGDYNRNGVVDAPDYVLWRKSLGQNANLMADGNNNGQIDPGDYEVWRANFGRMAASNSISSTGGAVPEPSPMMLLLIGASSLLRRQPRRIAAPAHIGMAFRSEVFIRTLEHRM